MKKALSIVLSLLLLTGFYTSAKVAYVPINAGSSGAGKPKAEMIHTQYGSYESACDGRTISQRITAKKPIAAIALNLPSWDNSIGKITVTIYKWDKNYAATLGGKPIGQRNFVDTPDNELFAIDISEPTNDILVHVADGTDKMGVWAPVATPVADVEQTTYLNGVETDRCLLTGIIWGKEKEEPKTETSSGKTRDAYDFIEPGSRDELH